MAALLSQLFNLILPPATGSVLATVLLAGDEVPARVQLQMTLIKAELPFKYTQQTDNSAHVN